MVDTRKSAGGRKMSNQWGSLFAGKPDPSDEESVSATMAHSAVPKREIAKKEVKQLRTGPALISLTNGKNSALVDRIEPRRSFADLMSSPDNKTVLSSFVAEFRQRELLKRHAIDARNRLLLCGPPGCGKTLAAEVLARELGFPLLLVRLDSVMSSFLGETASNLRRIFDDASTGPVVLFLDEFDAFARTREDSSENGEIRRVVNSLLQLIEFYNGRGIVIAATNIHQDLDEAIWRRFDDVLLFEKPNASQIKEFLLMKTKNYPTDFNVAKYSKQLNSLSFADIERICLDAIKLAILNKSTRIAESEFKTAVSKERRRQRIRMSMRGKKTK